MSYNECLWGVCDKDRIEGSKYCLEHKIRHEEHEKEKIQDSLEEGRFDYEDDIYCPYCGHKHELYDCDNSDIYEDGETEFNCQECNKTFKLEVTVSYSYSSEKLEEEDL